MKPFDVCGLGNALVDILLELTDAEFTELGFERGTMRLVDHAEQQRLLERFHGRDPRLVSGGSVANSVIACAQLGGRSAFIGCVGDDRYGLFYKTEFDELAIDIGNPVIVGQPTGTCLSIITPDAERTMRTCLAVSSHLSAKHVDALRIKDSQWLFVEGYVLANPDTGQGAVREAVRLAKAHGTKVALTCSEAFIVEVFGDAFRAALAQTDLLFCNASEAKAVTGAADAASAFQKLRDVVPATVVTDGPNGAFVRFGGHPRQVGRAGEPARHAALPRRGGRARGARRLPGRRGGRPADAGVPDDRRRAERLPDRAPAADVDRAGHRGVGGAGRAAR